MRKHSGRNHRNFRRKWHKTGFNRHHDKNPYIAHLAKNFQNPLYKIVQHKQKLDFFIVVIFRKNTTENTLKSIFLNKFTKKGIIAIFCI